MMNMIHGGIVIGRVLKELGVEYMFGVHGTGCYQWLEDCCREGIKMITVRHEQSGGFAADAYGRCARKPGVCYAGSAPGMLNITSPISDAYYARSPVVCLLGQHSPSSDKMWTIQEAYGSDVFRTFSKWTHRSVDENMHSYYLRRAFRDAMSYPPGPVVIEIPEGTCSRKIPDRQLHSIPTKRVAPFSPAQGDQVVVEKAVRMLIEAERPVLIGGDGLYWSLDASAEITELAELLQIPVNPRRLGRGAVPEDHPLAMRGGERQRLLDEADVICIFGLKATWLEEWFEPPVWNHDAKYIQVQENPEEFFIGLPSKLCITGNNKLVLRQMIDCASDLLKETPKREEWLDKLKKLKERGEKRLKESIESLRDQRPLHPDVVCQEIVDFLDPNATIIFDGYTGPSYLTDKIKAKTAGQVIDAGIHQGIGHGVGMALGAQLARPGKQVFVIIGDAGLGLAGMDLETLARYKVPAVFLCLNNNSWGGTSINQRLFYPTTDSWDFAPGIRYEQIFEKVGCHGEHVEEIEEVKPALERAYSSGKPAVINVPSTPTHTHPVSLRMQLQERWTRGDLAQLSEEARKELTRLSPRAVRRGQKVYTDMGVYMPLEDLAEIAGCSVEEARRYKVPWKEE